MVWVPEPDFCPAAEKLGLGDYVARRGGGLRLSLSLTFQASRVYIYRVLRPSLLHTQFILVYISLCMLRWVQFRSRVLTRYMVSACESGWLSCLSWFVYYWHSLASGEPWVTGRGAVNPYRRVMIEI